MDKKTTLFSIMPIWVQQKTFNFVWNDVEQMELNSHRNARASKKKC